LLTAVGVAATSSGLDETFPTTLEEMEKQLAAVPHDA